MLRLRRRSRTWVAVAILVVLTLLVGVVACNDTTSGSIPPTTGILIRAETLTTGRGCGVGSTQLFKYAVLVFGYSGGDPTKRESYQDFFAANVFDCYVDGEFVSLNNLRGNNIFRLEVYAYNEASYRTLQGGIANAVQTGLPTNGGNSAFFRSTTPLPTWTTECTATQSLEVETLAQCDPLTPGLGGVGTGVTQPTQIALATESFRLPDGRIAVCTPDAPVPTDAGADAEADAGAEAAAPFDDAGAEGGADTDAGDVAAADASSDAADAGEADAADAFDGAAPPAVVAFKTVRIRPRIGGTIVKDPVDLACPATYQVEVSSEPASYTIDVGLIDEAGQPLGQTTCSVTTATGTVNQASCE